MQPKLTVCKQPADSVPYGDSITTRGGYVWCVYSGETLLGVYATAKEAKRKHSIWPQRSKEFQRMMTQRQYNPGGKGHKVEP